MQSCSQENDVKNNIPADNSNPTPTPIPMVKTVKISNNNTLGKVLTDSKGMTLYFFSNDVKGTSLCTGGCVAAWPIFYTETLTLDEGLNTEDFGVITRADGTRQTTYKGWPLYYFSKDVAAGDIKGEKINNIWFVAKPDYTVMYANAQLIGKDSKDQTNNYIIAKNTDGTFINDPTQGSVTFSIGDGSTYYLTDDWGRTLYTFRGDTTDKNTWSNNNEAHDNTWPIFGINITEVSSVPSILNTKDFKLITTFGKTQVSYKGWPLYYFIKDVNRGENYGVGFPSVNVWPIINEKVTENMK